MRVKELLKEKGITAKELTAKLGMTETGLRACLKILPSFFLSPVE
jgi:DNA-binding Xre family transcriptional regulator